MAASISISAREMTIKMTALPSGTLCLNLDNHDAFLTIFFKNPADVAQFRYRLFEAIEGMLHEEPKKVVI